VPITKEEMTTPIVEKVIMEVCSDFNFLESICIAAAKSRKLNITFNNKVGKSMKLIACVVLLKNAGEITPILITASEAIKEISMIPIVRGNFIKRRLIYPKMAVNTITRVMIL
jgi:hypothetical protein